LQINYIDYSTNLFQKAIDNTKARVYVFDNNQNKIQAKKYYQQPFLAQPSLFLTISELKERLFTTDKLVLKEEKLTLIFYELLTKEDKEKLKINTYYDIIDLSAEFFNFYQELNEYNIDVIDNLTGWQVEKYQLFEELRERYIIKLEKLAYTDRTLVYDFDNFNPIFLADYQELVFINLLESTPKERELIFRLAEEGKEISIYNQIAKEDYDEGKLNLISVTLPDKLEQKVELYQSSEEFLQLVNALAKLDQSEEDYLILDGNFANSNYHNLLSAQKVKLDQDSSFTNSNLYRFLDTLHSLLKTADLSKKRLKLSMEALLAASYFKFFRAYYDLTELDLKNLVNLAQADYVYFDESLCLEGLESFKEVIDEVKRISKLSTLGEYIDFLKDLDKDKLAEDKYKNTISQYFGALAELNSIEEMNLVSSWNKYFKNSSEGLFRLILNYLRFKQIKSLENNEESRVEIKDLLNSSCANHTRLIMLNIYDGVIPTLSSSSFLLTEKQRSDLGLRTTEEIRLKEKYLFFRQIFSSQDVIIYTIKNGEKNIDSSSFLEELRLKYNLPLQSVELNEKHYPTIIDSIFPSSNNSLKDRLEITHRQQDSLKLEAADFEGQLSLSYYKATTLSNCHYCFFLEHIAKLSEERVEFKKKISPKMIGIIVHEVFETIINNYGNQIMINKGDLDEGIIRDILNLKLQAYELKLPNYYQKYYQEVLFELIETSIRGFFEKLKRKAPNIKKIDSEWSINREERRVFLNHQKAKVYLNGRLDLILEDENNQKYIIDYKTGSGSQEQLDFYSLLYNPDFKSEEIINKSIYNVMKEKFEDGKLNSEGGFAEKLQALLQNFLDSKEYSNQYKYYCNNCSYSEICKVVLK